MGRRVVCPNTLGHNAQTPLGTMPKHPWAQCPKTLGQRMSRAKRMPKHPWAQCPNTLGHNAQTPLGTMPKDPWATPFSAPNPSCEPHMVNPSQLGAGATSGTVHGTILGSGIGSGTFMEHIIKLMFLSRGLFVVSMLVDVFEFLYALICLIW